MSSKNSAPCSALSVAGGIDFVCGMSSESEPEFEYEEETSEDEHSLSSGEDSERVEGRSPGALDDYWKASSSSEEDFSNAEGGDDGQWEVEIIGEEVDWEGEVRFEATWPTWKREDGTNTTWNNDLIHELDYEPWETAHAAHRNALATDSSSIELWSTADVQNIATRLRAQAYEEKLNNSKGKPLGLTERMRKLDEEYWVEVAGEIPTQAIGSSPRPAKRQRKLSNEVDFPVPSSSRKPIGASPSRSSSTVALPVRPGEAHLSSSRTSASVSNRYITPPYSNASTSSVFEGKGKGKRVIREPSPLVPHHPITPSRSPSVRPQRPLPSNAKVPNRSHKSKRKLLESTWNLIAKQSGAAKIVLVNEEDDEKIPLLPPGFRYIEAGYIYASDVEDYTNEKALFVCCECHRCEDPNSCDCQSPSDLVGEDGRMFAYQNGLFAFNVPSGVEVIECNKTCKCDLYKCPNRVAQRPRDFPVEIFKTQNRGWGVRSSVDIKRGKVLGTYAGLLLKRDADLQSSYCFDLDGNEDLDQEVQGNAYTVDSENIGNWTRFINHSCTPNLSVYSVVYDTIPGTNQPYHAYYASQDIPAGTEFMFDYDPKAAELIAASKKKGKKKAVRPKDARDCLCGSSGCRGWVRV